MDSVKPILDNMKNRYNKLARETKQKLEQSIEERVKGMRNETRDMIEKYEALNKERGHFWFQLAKAQDLNENTLSDLVQATRDI